MARIQRLEENQVTIMLQNGYSYEDIVLYEQKNWIANIGKKLENEDVDHVDDKEASQDYKDLEDKDLDNDGDQDSSDSYLHNRLGAVAQNEAKLNKMYRILSELNQEESPANPGTGQYDLQPGDDNLREQGWLPKILPAGELEDDEDNEDNDNLKEADVFYTDGEGRKREFNDKK